MRPSKTSEALSRTKQRNQSKGCIIIGEELTHNCAPSDDFTLETHKHRTIQFQHHQIRFDHNFRYVILFNFPLDNIIVIQHSDAALYQYFVHQIIDEFIIEECGCANGGLCAAWPQECDPSRIHTCIDQCIQAGVTIQILAINDNVI